MAVTIELPHDIEENLRRIVGDLETAAKEAALVELYRQGRLSHQDLARALGTTRLEVETLLKNHGVIEDLPDVAEHEAALARLRTTSGK